MLGIRFFGTQCKAQFGGAFIFTGGVIGGTVKFDNKTWCFIFIGSSVWFFTSYWAVLCRQYFSMI
jgi:hypothetical protein